MGFRGKVVVRRVEAEKGWVKETRYKFNVLLEYEPKIE